MNSSIHHQRAIFLAAVCSQTYAQFANPDGLIVLPSPYRICHIIKAKSLTHQWEPFGFILEAPEELIIAFRGTSSTTNWIADMLASQTKFKYIQEDCQTHRGFTSIYASARKALLNAAAKLPANKPLFITGHSLGAALATLCALDLAANTAFKSPYLYTFGSPRVGDPAFAKTFSKYVPNSWRFANLFDIVTMAPPAVYKLPKREKRYYYSHVRTPSPLTFVNGAFGPNHVIGSYFGELSKLDPEFARQLNDSCPGFCPVPL
ncbi:lipase family protein [Paenibacillus physcomitrellae]|uniref:Lipase n=1 Tax=Paenibacillus physcomitrellae TaxID=1619311 RepID=A0ABQ1FPZ7_9BACL|nr:lipase family protein [Paenibacillus physcomitrellae]GGA24467.1 lipase [Paenibacillus physcomitrellae]